MTGIVAIRVQAAKYQSYHTLQEGGIYGGGPYSVVAVKDAEDNADLKRLESMPNVGGLISLNNRLIPLHLNSDLSLREAAARLEVDMVLLCTFDTTFHEDIAATALSAVTLDFSPMHHVDVRVTASPVLINTRTGLIYGAIEANQKKETYSTSWGSRQSADQVWREAETAAFKSLFGEFEKAWPAIVEWARKGT